MYRPSLVVLIRIASLPMCNFQKGIEDFRNCAPEKDVILVQTIKAEEVLKTPIPSCVLFQCTGGALVTTRASHTHIRQILITMDNEMSNLSTFKLSRLVGVVLW